MMYFLTTVNEELKNLRIAIHGFNGYLPDRPGVETAVRRVHFDVTRVPKSAKQLACYSAQSLLGHLIDTTDIHARKLIIKLLNRLREE